ncbi:MAG: hypothetical protein ACI4D6_03265 [Chordicoccus sp.]
MKKRIIKYIALFAIFCGGVALFSNLFFISRQQTLSASDLTDPTLPVVCIDIDGNKIDQLSGFTSEMNAKDMRDALIPISSKRSVTISYKAYKNTIRSVSYEVTTPDTGEVVENAKIGNFTSDGDYMTASFALSKPILMNREYPICFTIQTDETTVYYYANLIQRSDPVTSNYVQFVYDFYQNSLNAETSADLNSYLETDNTITNNTYTNVNLQSTLKQVSWGSLAPTLFRKAVPKITEINDNTCSMTNEYILSATNDAGETEYYRVTEFYRMRYYNSKMYLLNFTRDAEQIFDGNSGTAVTASGVNLGIASKSVQYMSDDAGDLVAFVQNGALWEFNSSTEKLSEVFSFTDGTSADERYDNTDCDIKLIRTYEGGGLDFMVYGYMSRGEHEGQMGIMVCHYNAESSVVTEKVFIPYNKSWQLLKHDIARFSYMNTDGDVYLYLDRSLYRIKNGTNQAETLLTDITPECFVANTDNNMIAYQNEMKENASQTVTVMDLDNGKTKTISAGSGQYIKALGFFGDDFMYGVANQSDLVTDTSGAVTFPMCELKVESFDGTVKKDYKADGIYVTGVTMEPGLAELTRATKNSDGSYAATSDDTILNSSAGAASSVTVSTSNTTRQGTTVTLAMASTVTNLKPTVGSFQVQYAGSESADLNLGSDSGDYYYVYAYGGLQGIYSSAAEAVTTADADVGAVVDSEGQYVYERGARATKVELNNDDIPSAFLSGETNADKLQSMLDEAAASSSGSTASQAESVAESTDSATTESSTSSGSSSGSDTRVINLTGCTLDEVLYEVSQGRAVATRLADGSAAVIVGYDQYNTRLYNFSTGEHYYMGMNDSTASMQAAGNIFISYVAPQATLKDG